MRGRKRAALAALIGWFLLVTAVSARAEEVLSAEQETLARVMAERMPAVSYAARVGVAAVVRRRATDEAGPGSVGAALEELIRGGAFGDGAIDHTPDSESLRLSREAVRAAWRGADPTEGATEFRVAGRVGGVDFRFDDGREDTLRKRTGEALADCRIVIDGVGFW